MYAEMICNCASSLSIDSAGGAEDATWHLIWRFVNAHVSCGFASSGKSEEDAETFKEQSLKTNNKVQEDDEEEEEEEEDE